MTNTFINIHDNGFYFRVFGYGLAVINRDQEKPLFSVRNGYTKEYRVGKWGIQFLS